MVKLFFSYSHKDEALRDQLETPLAMLKNQGLIESWHDRRIVVGSDLDDSIQGSLEAADVVLLLVSSDFLASTYCYSKEMARAMEKHQAGEAHVIPVILRHCDWHAAPFGGLLAAPKDGKAITSWPDIDEALADVARQVRRVVEEKSALSNKQPPQLGRATQTTLQAPPASATMPSTGPRSSNLRLAKEFTQKDKDDFLRGAFDFLARFFEGSLQAIAERNPGSSFSFERIDSRRFAATLYKDGDAVAQGSARLDSMGGRGSTCIAYSHDAQAREGSSNEMLHIEATDQSLYLKPLGFSWSGNNSEKSHLSHEGGAEYLWGLFIRQAQ